MRVVLADAGPARMHEDDPDELLDESFHVVRRVAAQARGYRALVEHLAPGLYDRARELVRRLDDYRRRRALGDWVARLVPCGSCGEDFLPLDPRVRDCVVCLHERAQAANPAHGGTQPCQGCGEPTLALRGLCVLCLNRHRVAPSAQRLDRGDDDREVRRA